MYNSSTMSKVIQIFLNFVLNQSKIHWVCSETQMPRILYPCGSNCEKENCSMEIYIIIIILSCYQSTCWMKASAFLFHDNLFWAFCFHVTDLQKSSISSLHLFEGLPLGRLPFAKIRTPYSSYKHISFN